MEPHRFGAASLRCCIAPVLHREASRPHPMQHLDAISVQEWGKSARILSDGTHACFVTAAGIARIVLGSGALETLVPDSGHAHRCSLA